MAEDPRELVLADHAVAVEVGHPHELLNVLVGGLLPADALVDLGEHALDLGVVEPQVLVEVAAGEYLVERLLRVVIVLHQIIIAQRCRAICPTSTIDTPVSHHRHHRRALPII